MATKIDRFFLFSHCHVGFFTGWWNQICFSNSFFFMFTPIFFGEDEPIFEEHIFQRGLVQPPNNGQKGGLGRLVVWIAPPGSPVHERDLGI